MGLSQLGILNAGVAGTSSIHSQEYHALLDLLRKERRRSGLSQAELADKLDRPQSWVSKVEVGERRLDLDLEELRQVCDAIEIDLVKLVRKWLQAI
ncbi:MAG TPA: helix-turn-helix transcriptional regulator [Chloroflexota bacterium]|nr:helix-turn-helix transcriptional regulator [Chloroflexota bacterium]